MSEEQIKQYEALKRRQKLVEQEIVRLQTELNKVQNWSGLNIVVDYREVIIAEINRRIKAYEMETKELNKQIEAI